MPNVLSLFPGLGLLDAAFEEQGFTIYRGPDILWGGDARRFHATPGFFAGVIGGPPCQSHSSAGEIVGTEKEDLIPDFLRIVDEAKPAWVVMENVRGTLGHPSIPRSYYPAILRDWDCGGHTSRTRVFYTWPFMLLAPSKRPGDPSKSVMASTWKRGRTGSQYLADKGFLAGDLPPEEYARLQGAEPIARPLLDLGAGRRFIIHLVGNGVPRAMAREIAIATRRAMHPELPEPTLTESPEPCP